MNFNGASGATSYEYRAGTDMGMNWTAATEEDTGYFFPAVLTPGTAYTLEMRGVNADGPGPSSNQATGTTAGAVSITGGALTPDPGTDKTCALGDDVEATLTFSRVVTVTGTPQLELDFGGTGKAATCAAVMQQTTVVCTYEVVAGDAAPAGVAIAANKLTRNGGTIRLGSGSTANTHYTVPLAHAALAADTNHKVDGVKPTLVTTGGGAPKRSSDGTKVILTFSEAIGAVDCTRITVKSGTTILSTTADSMSGSTVEISLTTALTSSDTSVTVELAADAVDDLAGNGNDAVAAASVTLTDDTAPALTGASTPSNTEVLLSCDEALDSSSIPDKSAFTVEVGGIVRPVSSVAMSGDMGLTLTLDSAFRPGDTLTVSYEPPATDPIQDEAGNDASSFTGKAVSNDLAPTAPDAPGNLVATAGSVVGEAALAWDTPWHNGSPIEKYQVRHVEGSVAGATWTDIPNSAPGEQNANRYVVAGLEPGTEYAFEVRAVNGVGPGPEATGKIVDSDPIPRAWLARFGRTVAGHVVDAVAERIEGSSGGGSHVMLGGQRVALDGVLNGTSPGGTAGRGDAVNRPVSRTLGGRELLLGSSFRLAAGDEGADGAGTAWTAWGRAAVSRFDGEADGLSVDGDVTTLTLGADAVRGRWLGGVALAHSTGEGGYRDHADTEDHAGQGSGKLESTLTSVHPCVRFRASERLTVWGGLGHGTGDLTLEVDAPGTQPRKTDTDMRMAAAGARGVLVSAAETGGFELAARVDSQLVRMRSDAASGSNGAGNLAATEARTSRLRVMLEGLHRIVREGGQTLTPSLEAGLRHDGGDAETGTGIEVGGGLGFSDPARGLAVTAKARGLLAHEDADYREWGVSGAVRIDPGAVGRGLSLTIAPASGAASGGAERLWSARDARALAANDAFENGAFENDAFEPAGRLEAEAGYGLAAFGGRGLATPFTRLSVSDAGDRTWRPGVRWSLGPDIAVGIEGARREPANGNAAEHEIGFRIGASWQNRGTQSRGPRRGEDWMGAGRRYQRPFDHVVVAFAGGELAHAGVGGPEMAAMGAAR